MHYSTLGLLMTSSSYSLSTMLTGSPISFFFTDPPTTEIYTLSLHDALPISAISRQREFLADAASVQFTRNAEGIDRKSTRLNSSHVRISYAVFCLKKKK